MSTAAKCLMVAVGSLAAFTIIYSLISTLLTDRDTRRRKRRKKDPEVLGKVVEKHVSEDGLTFTAKLTTHGEDAVDALRFATGYKDTLEDGIGFWADGKLMQTVTPNEHRELHSMKPIMKGPLPQPVKYEPGTVEYWDGETTHTFYINEYPKDMQKRSRTIRKRCAYCGTVSDKDFGTCDHCGAPL